MQWEQRRKNISLVRQARLHCVGGVDLRCNGCAGLFSALGSEGPFQNGDAPHEMSQRSTEYSKSENGLRGSVFLRMQAGRLVIWGEGRGRPGSLCIPITEEGSDGKPVGTVRVGFWPVTASKVE